MRNLLFIFICFFALNSAMASEFMVLPVYKFSTDLTVSLDGLASDDLGGTIPHDLIINTRSDLIKNCVSKIESSTAEFQKMMKDRFKVEVVVVEASCNVNVQKRIADNKLDFNLVIIFKFLTK